jgi:hypothetical protein
MKIAELEYEAAGMDLKARYEEERNAIYLTLADAELRKLTVKIPDDDNLAPVLDLIAVRQDRLHAGNYNAFVNALVKLSPGTRGLRDGKLVDLEGD